MTVTRFLAPLAGIVLLFGLVVSCIPSAPENIHEAAANTIVRISDKSGHGSGVVIRSDGLILTNRHVVDGIEDPVVTLRNGNTFPATVLWVSSDKFDLALIRVNTHLAAATIRTEPLKLGEAVFAVGHPGEFDWSVAFGHVANTGGRTLLGIDGLLQIDLDINVGNSGGGLFDMQGLLVGLPNSIAFIPMWNFAPPVSTDISFAVPIRDVCLMMGCPR